jgi:hypothetical protein|tara:strand:- start:1538 stop:2017 length:480 start_codon:yes stop_codon:yes gene_type:complete
MTLYIKVDASNNPIGHPHLEDNIKQLYPNHDFSSPPAGWLEFVRKQPELGVYQKFNETIGADISLAYKHNGLEYKLIDGKIQDYWNYIDMTDDEKKAKQDDIKARWAALDPAGPASWTFDEATCTYKAPVDTPSDAASPDNPDGVNYKWNEETLSWDKI